MPVIPEPPPLVVPPTLGYGMGQNYNDYMTGIQSQNTSIDNTSGSSLFGSSIIGAEEKLIPGVPFGYETSVRDSAISEPLFGPFDFLSTMKTVVGGLFAATIRILGKEGAEFVAKESIGFAKSQLQHEFKHAPDFGITANQSNKALADFSTAIQQHISATDTLAISGTFRGQPVTYFVNPVTGLNVMKDSAGNFLGGWEKHSNTY